MSVTVLSIVDKELIWLHVLAGEADAVQGGVTEGKLVLVEVVVQEEAGPHAVHKAAPPAAPAGLDFYMQD